MGYTTRFDGELMFTREPTASELAFIKSLFWIDRSDVRHRSLKQSKGEVNYVQFELTDRFDGIRWDGSEKFYKPVEAANFLIENMREHCAGLSLTGAMEAQGEDFDDRWSLVIGEDGWATRVERPMKGRKVTCPHCDEVFVLEES